MSIAAHDPTYEWLSGGELAVLTRTFDWSRTPVGPISRWPATLRNTVSMMLACRQPMFLWWGEELVQFYNDAYRPSLGGDRHPQGLGARGREFWADIWEVIGPLIDRVRSGGPAVWAVDQRIPIQRDGGFQEVYWTFSYSAVRDDAGQVAGVLVVCTETTEKVVGERRQRLFKELALEGLAATDGADAGRCAAAVLARNTADAPFAAIYLNDPETGALQRVGAHNLDEAAAPPAVRSGESAPWPLWEAMQRGGPLLLDDVQRRAPGVTGAPWPEPVTRASILPFFGPGEDAPRGVLVLGLSARLPLSDAYRDFCSLLATQVGGVVAHADGAERTRRALELEHAAREDAELKAGFEQQLIGIVSHDLRTPLSSILLTSKALLRRSEELDVRTTTSVARIQSSAERAVRLVRDLLDFTQARLGDGIPVLPRALDLHELVRTALDELRATYPEREFRLEQGGAGEGSWDRDRLAQVLTNLVVNAVKYGRADAPITLTSAGLENGVTLEVHNFGEPVPPEKLANLFQPLRRSSHSERDAERSVGLGLYIVDQIVRAHGGRVEVRSTDSEGTTFRVHLPRATPAAGQKL